MKKRILILGASGMLGHVLFREFSEKAPDNVFATLRDRRKLPNLWNIKYDKNIISGIDADNIDQLIKVIADVQPNIVINCIGIIKQLPSANNSIDAISINALYPHRLAQVCKLARCRLIHISTDCVFDGKKGNYIESDPSNAMDLYGRTKYMGELEYDHCVTLRTSIIGHEISSNISLVDWFLSQDNSVKGYNKAIYTGFPTIELSEIIWNHVIPNRDLHGLYHVSSDRISKFELLNIVAETYEKQIEIVKDESFILDRSLISNNFRNKTGYIPPAWPILIKKMYADYINNKEDYNATV